MLQVKPFQETLHGGYCGQASLKVVGLNKENIYLQDPEIGTMRTIKRDDFLRVWFDFKNDHITSWQDMIIRQLIAIYPKQKHRSK